MFDDLVYDFVIFNKGNNAHGSPAVRTSDPRKSTLWIAAVQVFFYYLLDNGTQVTKVSFKPVLIFQKK